MITMEMETHRVQVYRWTGAKDGRDRFYLVDAALEFIERSGQEPNATLSLKDVHDGLARNAEAFTLDLHHIAKADLSKPVIFITVWNEDNHREEQILIDGWHRFRKAAILATTEPLQAYVFSLEDSKLLEVEL